MEMLINEHVHRHLESNKIIPNGFQSTDDIYVAHTWNKTRETLAVAVDISKAVDQVWRKNLLAKLPIFAFTPTLCKCSESFLKNRSIKVVFDGTTTSLL